MMGLPPPAPNTQPGKRPGVWTQTFVPLNFSAVVAPLTINDDEELHTREL